MARYHFVTALRIGADRQRVWDRIVEPLVWPSWWRWLRRVELLDRGGQQRVGARHRYTFGTALPYSLSFDTTIVRVVAPAVLEATATGDLDGSALLQLAERADGSTDVTYTWLVETTKRWMNAVAPIARPAFSRNHDVLLRDFGVGLARASEGDLIAIDNTTVAPSVHGFYELPSTEADGPGNATPRPGEWRDVGTDTGTAT